MASFGFFLASPNRDKSTIFIIARIGKNRLKQSIGITCETKFWIKEKQICQTSKYRDGITVNAIIDKYTIAIKRILLDISSDKYKIPINSKEFGRMLDCIFNGIDYIEEQNTATNYSLREYFQTIFISRSAVSKSETRIRRFTVVLSLLKRFEDSINKIYLIHEVDMAFYRHFQDYLFQNKYSVNYFGAVIKIIKQVMREAEIIDNIPVNQQYKHSMFKSVSQDIDSIYLSKDELLQIATLEISDSFVHTFYPKADADGLMIRKATYSLVRDKFLIGAFTGLRISDYNNLNAENISDGKITVITQKTKQKVIIPIHPIVQNILDKGFDTTNRISDQKINIYIKDICKYLKIDSLVDIRVTVNGRVEKNQKPKYELVSSHTARRSFATNAYLAGVPTLSIMKITGHTKEGTFMKYIRIGQEENANLLANHSFFQ